MVRDNEKKENNLLILGSHRGRGDEDSRRLGAHQLGVSSNRGMRENKGQGYGSARPSMTFLAERRLEKILPCPTLNLSKPDSVRLARQHLCLSSRRALAFNTWCRFKRGLTEGWMKRGVECTMMFTGTRLEDRRHTAKLGCRERQGTSSEVARLCRHVDSPPCR